MNLAKANARNCLDPDHEMKSPAMAAKARQELLNVPKHGKGPVFWGHSTDPNRVVLSQMVQVLLDMTGCLLTGCLFMMFSIE